MMKKIPEFKKTIKIPAVLLLFLVLASSELYSQSCEVTLRNDSLEDAYNLVVDIYVKSTSGTFYYSSGQYKINFNKTAILNGGTITGSIVPGFSDLTNASQIPTTVNATASTYWRIPAEANPTSQASCSQISSAGTGTRICRVRLTNTAQFGQSAMNNILVSTIPTATSVWYAASDGSAFPATINLVNTNLINPVLNSPLTVFNVTGGGSSPSHVGLDGSQSPGVNYILYKDGTSEGSAVAGTGSALDFGSKTTGNYTVRSHRIAT